MNCVLVRPSIKQNREEETDACILVMIFKVTNESERSDKREFKGQARSRAGRRKKRGERRGKRTSNTRECDNTFSEMRINRERMLPIMTSKQMT